MTGNRYSQRPGRPCHSSDGAPRRCGGHVPGMRLCFVLLGYLQPVTKAVRLMVRQRTEDVPAIHLSVAGRDVWAVSAVESYRVIAGSWPKAEHVVWELGAATGAATVLAAEVAAEVFAVEKAPEKLDKLRAATAGHENVRMLDADVMAERPSVPADSRADWLLVDLGGDAPPWRTMLVAERWAQALDCSQVVVRNSALFEAASSAAAVGSLTEASAARAVPDAGDAAPGVREASTAVLRQRVLEAVSPEIAARLVDALGKSGFRERQRLVDALADVGHVALQPLVRLVGDTRASLAARRSAAEALKQVLQAIGRAEADALESPSIPVQWALAEAEVPERPSVEGPGADVVSAEKEGKAAPATSLLRMLADEDEFVRFIARSHLRHAGPEATTALAAEMSASEITVAAMVAGLDALGVSRGLPAEQVVDRALKAAPADQRADVTRRLACACLGVADQKWASGLWSALGDRPEVKADDIPVEQLKALYRAAQREPLGAEARRLVGEIVDAGVSADELSAAAASSPHGWMRQVGEQMASWL